MFRSTHTSHQVPSDHLTRTYADSNPSMDEGSQPFAALLWQATSIFPLTYPISTTQITPEPTDSTNPTCTTTTSQQQPDYFSPSIGTFDQTIYELHRLCTKLPLHRREIPFLSTKPMLLPVWNETILTELLNPLAKISQHILAYAHTRPSPLDSTEIERFFNYSLFGTAFDDIVALDLKGSNVVHKVGQFRGVLWGVVKNLSASPIKPLPNHPATSQYPENNNEITFVPMTHGDMRKFHYRLQLQSRFWVKLLSCGNFLLPDVAPTSYNSARTYQYREQDAIPYKIPSFRQEVTSERGAGVKEAGTEATERLSSAISPSSSSSSSEPSSQDDIRTAQSGDWRNKLQLLLQQAVTAQINPAVLTKLHTQDRFAVPDISSRPRDATFLPLTTPLGLMLTLSHKLPLSDAQYVASLPAQKQKIIEKKNKIPQIDQIFLEYVIYSMLWDALYRTIGFDQNNNDEVPLVVFNSLDDFSTTFNTNLDASINIYFQSTLDIALAQKLFPDQSGNFADGIRLATTFLREMKKGEGDVAGAAEAVEKITKETNSSVDASSSSLSTPQNLSKLVDLTKILHHSHKMTQFAISKLPVKQPNPFPKTFPETILSAIYGYTMFLPPLYPPRLAYPSSPLIYLHSHELLSGEDLGRKRSPLILQSELNFLSAYNSARFQSMHDAYNQQAECGFKTKTIWTYEEFCLQYIMWAPVLYTKICAFQDTILQTQSFNILKKVITEREKEIRGSLAGIPWESTVDAISGRVVLNAPPYVEKIITAEITTELDSTDYSTSITITQIEDIDIATTRTTQKAVNTDSKFKKDKADGVVVNLDEHYDVPSCYRTDFESFLDANSTHLNPNDLLNTFDNIPYVDYTQDQADRRTSGLNTVWKLFSKVSTKDWPYKGLDYNIIHESFFVALEAKDPTLKPFLTLSEITSLGLEEVAIRYYEHMRTNTAIDQLNADQNALKSGGDGERDEKNKNEENEDNDKNSQSISLPNNLSTETNQMLSFADIIHSIELSPRRLYQSTKDCFMGAPQSVYHLELFDNIEKQPHAEKSPDNNEKSSHVENDNIEKTLDGDVNIIHKTVSHITTQTITKSTTKQPSLLQKTRPIEYFQAINSMSWVRYYCDPYAQPRVDDFFTLLHGFEYKCPSTGQIVPLIYPSQLWLSEANVIIEPGQLIEYGSNYLKWVIKFPTTPVTRQCDAFVMAILHRAHSKVLEVMFLSMNVEIRELLFNIVYDVTISTPFSHQNVELHFWDLFTIANTRDYAPELTEVLLSSGRIELDEVEKKKEIFLKE